MSARKAADWRKQVALTIAAQLPANRDDAVVILRMVEMLMEWELIPADQMQTDLSDCRV